MNFYVFSYVFLCECRDTLLRTTKVIKLYASRVDNERVSYKQTSGEYITYTTKPFQYYIDNELDPFYFIKKHGVFYQNINNRVNYYCYSASCDSNPT